MPLRIVVFLVRCLLVNEFFLGLCYCRCRFWVIKYRNHCNGLLLCEGERERGREKKGARCESLGGVSGLEGHFYGSCVARQRSCQTLVFILSRVGVCKSTEKGTPRSIKKKGGRLCLKKRGECVFSFLRFLTESQSICDVLLVPYGG